MISSIARGLCYALAFSLGCSAFGKGEIPKPKKLEPKSSEASQKTNDVKKADEEKKPDPIKPYNKVITKEAKSERGLFAVHRVDDKFYFEIPTNEFGKEQSPRDLPSVLAFRHQSIPVGAVFEADR